MAEIEKKVDSLKDFRHWVKVQLVYKDMSQNELARHMGIPHARISEATHGKPTGQKYISSIILELGGNPADFQSILD